VNLGLDLVELGAIVIAYADSRKEHRDGPVSNTREHALSERFGSRFEKFPEVRHDGCEGQVR
jgi:hypothetical protein